MAQALAFFVLSTAVSAVISFAFPAEGPRLKDLSISASTYGNAIPRVWGTVRVGANMIWANQITEHKHKKKAGIGQFYNQYTYSCDFAMALCKGPALALRRVWANGKLIFDATGGSATVTNGKYKFRFYNGSEEQLPDSLIVAAKGEGNAPAYRGTAYIVFEEFDLSADFGNQIPQIAAEVYVGGDTATPVTYLTTDGTTAPEFTLSALNATDFERSYVYLRDSDHIKRFKMADGIQNLDVAPTLPSENFWDTGKLSELYGVYSDGSVFCAIGGNNNNVRVALLDPFSLQPTASAGHSVPIPGLGGSTTDPPFYDSPRIVYFDDTRTHALSVAFTGEFWAFAGVNGFQLDRTIPNITGNRFAQIAACGRGENEWIVATSTGLTFADNDFKLRTLKGQNGVVDELGPFALTNPDAGSGSTYVQVLGVAHDTSTNAAIVFYVTSLDRYYATKFSFDTESVVWQTELPGGFPSNGWVCTQLMTDVVAWKIGNRLWLVNSGDGTFVNRGPDEKYYTDNDWLQISDLEYTNPGNEGYALPSGIGNGFQQYDGITGNLTVMASNGEKPTIIRVGQFGNDTVTLDFIIVAMLSETGLTPDQYDVSALESISIRGYGFANSTDLKGVFGELQQIFLFDLIESNGKIVASIRGSVSSVETISYKALGSQGGDNNDRADYWKETRFSEADLPMQVSLAYFNSDLDYETNTAVSKRILAPLPTMFSRQQDAVEASIVLTATEAKNRVNAMLYVAWAERTKHQTKLPLAYAYLEPTDMITVVMADSRTYFERIERQEMGADFTTDTDTRGQDSGAYTFNLTGDGGDGFRQVMQVPQPARAFILNTPYLRDIDATGDGVFSIFYMGVGNMGSATFNGATLFQSPDGQTYAVADAFEHDCEWGSLKDKLAPPSHGCFALDWESQLTIYPASQEFELESITDAELMQGGNLCVVGNEVIQFRDAVQNDDGSWTISNLLRGRRGTEYACDTHQIGEFFLFLDANTIDIGQEPLDAGGTDVWFKAVGQGRAVDSAPTLEIEYEPRDLMPYAPADIRRDITGGDITLTWERRTRLGGNMMDGTGTVPLGETSESYQIYILTAPFDGDLSHPDLPNNIKRVYTATTSTVTYSAADQSTDSFDNTTDTLHVAIFQISSAVGRGFPGVRSIDATAIF